MAETQSREKIYRVRFSPERAEHIATLCAAYHGDPRLPWILERYINEGEMVHKEED